MQCRFPLTAWRGATRNPATGKRPIVFGQGAALYGDDSTLLKIPCNQCIGCRLEYSRGWAVRCMHEASLHERNCFVTLTYDDAHLPPYGSLRKRDVQLFLKRLRKAHGKVRVFYAGEYGERFGRPHYHLILFGFDFDDKYQWTVRNDFPCFRSAELERLWPLGVSEIGSVTFESAAYVARYVVKKITGRDAEIAYSYVDEDGVIGRVEADFAEMSRRPGIARKWFEQFRSEVVRNDGVLVGEHLTRPPRYYDLIHAEIDPDGAAAVCAARRRRRNREDDALSLYDQGQRDIVKAACAEAKVNLFARKVE